MKTSIFTVTAVLFAVGLGGWYFLGPGSDMSGTYVGKNATQAFLVQIVQGSNGQLSGFYEEAGLSADGGGVNQDNIPLTGQRDGKTFTITLAPSGIAHFFEGSVRATEVRVIALNPEGKRLSWSIGVPPDKI